MQICTNIGKCYVTVRSSCNLSLQSVRNSFQCSAPDDFIPKTTTVATAFWSLQKNGYQASAIFLDFSKSQPSNSILFPSSPPLSSASIKLGWFDTILHKPSLGMRSGKARSREHVLLNEQNHSSMYTKIPSFVIVSFEGDTILLIPSTLSPYAVGVAVFG